MAVYAVAAAHHLHGLSDAELRELREAVGANGSTPYESLIQACALFDRYREEFGREEAVARLRAEWTNSGEADAVAEASLLINPVSG